MEIKGHTVTSWATWAGLLQSGILLMLRGIFSTEGWQVLSCLLRNPPDVWLTATMHAKQKGPQLESPTLDCSQLDVIKHSCILLRRLSRRAQRLRC